MGAVEVRKGARGWNFSSVKEERFVAMKPAGCKEVPFTWLALQKVHINCINLKFTILQVLMHPERREGQWIPLQKVFHFPLNTFYPPVYLNHCFLCCP